ncbi:MAG: RDD family protein [Sedimenticola sp.]
MTEATPGNTPQATDSPTGFTLEPAPLKKRLAAMAIDLGVLSIILIPLVLTLTRGESESLWPYVMNSFPAWLLIVGGNLFILDSSGQTLGKRVMKLKIVADSGAKAAFSRLLFLRYLPFLALLLIPYAGALILIALVISIFREDRRGIHDRLSGTRVVAL